MTGPYNQAEIIDAQNVVDRVTTSDWSPFLDCGIGYVRFGKADDWSGESLLMQTRQGELLTCEIIALPFYDSEKRIPRGLEPADS